MQNNVVNTFCEIRFGDLGFELSESRVQGVEFDALIAQEGQRASEGAQGKRKRGSDTAIDRSRER